jgi:micrococcal nuclease
MPESGSVKTEELKASLYHYRAKVTDVYDGDTCTVEIDLGLSTWVRGEKVRLNRINAPEMRGADAAKGTKSRDFLRGLILGKDVLLQTIKDAREKYGRYLGEIWVEKDGKSLNVSDVMVQNGHAVYQKY